MKAQASLASKDYLLSILAGGIFLIVNFVMLSFGPAYLDGYGYSTFLAGFQNTIFSLFCVIFRLYFAPLADVRGRRSMMLVGMAAFVLGMFFFYLARGSYLLVVLARLFMALGMASYLSSASCYVSEIVSQKDQGLAIGIQRAVYSLALLLGPLGAIQMIDSSGGYQGLFLSLMGLSLLGVFILVFIRDSQIAKKDRVDLGAIIGEYRLLVGQKQTRDIYLRLLPVTVSYGAVLSYVTIYLAGFGLTEQAGIFFTAFALAGLMGNVVGGSALGHFSHLSLSKLFASANALGVALLFWVPYQPLVAMLLAGTIAGFGFTSSIAVIINWLVQVVPGHMRGTALGLQESCIDGGIALGSLIFGLLAGLLPQQTIYLILGLSALTIPYLLTDPRPAAGSKKEKEAINAISNK